MKCEGDQKWVDEHMGELTQYEGEMIAVVDGEVIAHGTEWNQVEREAERKGHSYPFMTRIEQGKHIDLYSVPGFSIVERPD